MAWREFYRQFPFDDIHRYHRPAALVATSQAQKDRSRAIENALSWLTGESASTAVPEGDWSEADLRTLKALGFKP